MLTWRQAELSKLSQWLFGVEHKVCTWAQLKLILSKVTIHTFSAMVVPRMWRGRRTECNPSMCIQSLKWIHQEKWPLHIQRYSTINNYCLTTLFQVCYFVDTVVQLKLHSFPLLLPRWVHITTLQGYPCSPTHYCCMIIVDEEWRNFFAWWVEYLYLTLIVPNSIRGKGFNVGYRHTFYEVQDPVFHVHTPFTVYTTPCTWSSSG